MADWGTRYRLTLKACSHAAPPAARLRRLLKYAWRALGFRAESVEELPPENPPGTTEDTERGPSCTP